MVTRDAFLYMDPQGDRVKEFGQCSTCVLWTGPERKTCTIHGRGIEIDGGDSCGLYISGSPDESGREKALVTPEESGLVSRKVRCENCAAYLPKLYSCDLFHKLNKSYPKLFDLEETVHPLGCCNAQHPKGK